MGKFLVESSISESDESKTSVQNRDMGDHLDPYYGSDLPPNVLFPDQLNKYLRDQIQNLTLENGSLRRSLEEMQSELSSHKQKMSKTALPIAGRASEIAANKIAELSKRVREQTAELEGLKTRAKDAEAKVRHYESSSVDQMSEPPPPLTEEEVNEKDKQIRTLAEKLQASNTKLCDFRNQCQALRQELKLAQKVIENEVGEKVSWQELVKENGSWRGRAQQIISLQNKIQHLQDQLSTSGAAETPAATLLRQMEKDRRASYEETSKQLNQKTIQLEEIRKKWEASKARNKILENEIIQVKTKLSSLTEKAARDEQLVVSLTNQINAFEDRGKAQTQCLTKMQDNIYKLQQEVDFEKQKNDQLQKALAERENRTLRLEEQLEELRKMKKMNREGSPPPQRKPGTPSRLVEATERKKVFNVIDSERMRLLELLAVVNRRLDDSRREQMIVEAQLKKEKFRNAKLETKVARLELERVGALKTGRGSYSQTHIKTADPSIEDANIMARQHIEYLEEECLALKTRIETLQMEKEDDLKVFAAMTDMREKMLEKKTEAPAKKASSPRDKRNASKLPARRPKHQPPKARKIRSTMGHEMSSFSSEDSNTQ